MQTHSRTDFDASLAADLEALRATDLARELRIVSRLSGALVETPTGRAIDFSSNDYLGLATDPRLAAAAATAARERGTGSGAARLISGDNVEHELLERELAAFLGAEAVLTFANGYAANVGAIPALVHRGDAIFADALNHASLIDGCRLSRATVHVYPHADVAALAALLAEHRAAGGHRRALIVTDGMFSMDGDTAPLEAIVRLAREYDAWTYVDDAHAIGVTGDNGRGSLETLGLEGEIDVLVGTLGKAFGSAGAFVAGSAALRELLLNRARSFVFSTGAPPAQSAASRAALGVIRDEPGRRARVSESAALLREALASRGIACAGEAGSHIIPIVVGAAATTMAVGRRVGAAGFLVGAVRPPTVPEGTSRLRLTVTAAHTREQITALAEALVAALHAEGCR